MSYPMSIEKARLNKIWRDEYDADDEFDKEPDWSVDGRCDAFTEEERTEDGDLNVEELYRITDTSMDGGWVQADVVLTLNDCR